jgi:citrate lyase subunit beta/citryl-CoA lyase
LSKAASWLYAPGNRLDRVDKAMASSADRVIVDLEDACPLAEKMSSREGLIGRGPRWPERPAYLRINGLETAYALGDFEAAVAGNWVGIILPKTESRGQLATVDWILTQLEQRQGRDRGALTLVPLIETAKGISQASEIARAPTGRLERLMLGGGDLTTDLGSTWSRDERELQTARDLLVLASVTAGIARPIDTPWPFLDDDEGLSGSALLVRSAGFGGKAAIHPKQVAAINDIFAPDPKMVAEAERLLDAYQEAAAQGSGAFQFEGKLVDRASVKRAQAVLEGAGITRKIEAPRPGSKGDSFSEHA